MPEPTVPGVLEIRVHGVSGTPAQDMLGVGATEVGQVAGDRLTGLYRCKGDATPHGVTVPPFVAVEAYSWGALTSGAAGFLGWARRAAWLTLLPFALGNMAYWARPELDTTAPVRKATAIVVRLACLLLTLLLVAGVSLIGIDLVAWQCFRGGTLVCSSLPSALHFLDRPPWDTASRRVLVGSLLPLLMLVGLWFLSRQSLARYEEVVAKTTPRLGSQFVLRRQRMWAGGDRTGRLQLLHLAGGVCVVIMSGTFPLGLFDGSGQQPALAGLGVAAAVAEILVAIAVALGYKDGIDFPGTQAGNIGRGRRLARFAWWVVVCLLIAYVLLLGTSSDVVLWEQAGPLRGHNVVVGGLLFLLVAGVGWLIFAADHPWWSLLVPAALLGISGAVFLRWWVVATVLVIVLFALGFWFQHRRADPDPVKPRAWTGAGTAVLLGGSVWIAAVFTTSTVVLAADWLNGGVQSVADLQSGFREDASPGARAAQLQARSPALTATGPVVVRGGAVSVDDTGVVTVYSGTVTASSLRSVRVIEGIKHLVPGLDLTSGAVFVADPPVTLVDSCVGAGGDVPSCADPGSLGSRSYPAGEYVASGAVESSGALLIRAADDGVRVHVETADIPQEPLIVPQVLIWFALAMPFWLVAVIVVAVVNFLVFRRRARTDVFRQTKVDGIDRLLVEASGKARMAAGFTHRTERLLGLVGTATVVAALAVIVGASTGAPPWQDYGRLRAVANVGLWLAVGVSAGLVAVGARMRTSQSARRAVGVLWDLSTFWPRVAHPLGPPCYAERVVPEVVSRVRWAAAQGANVILSGHSQGSLIAVAASSQLGDEQTKGLRVVTYGSQVRTWYGRIFPGVLGPAAIGNLPLSEAAGFATAAPDAPDPGGPGSAFPGGPTGPEPSLGARLRVSSESPRWVNLFRRTDPIGFRVFSDEQSRVDRYVSEYSPGGAGDPSPRIQTHSRYQFSAEYREVVEQWYAEPGYPQAAVGVVCQVDFLVPE